MAQNETATGLSRYAALAERPEPALFGRGQLAAPDALPAARSYFK